MMLAFSMTRTLILVFLALKIELLFKIKGKMYLCVFTKWLGEECYSPVLVFKLDSKKDPSFEIVSISSGFSVEILLPLHGSKCQEFSSFWILRKYFFFRCQMPKALLEGTF